MSAPWFKHGLHRGGRHPLLKTWEGMIARCHKPTAISFRHYGARGITVCARWRESFPAFVADMGPRPEGHTLDRVDSGGNYEPSNCRWATPKQQMSTRSHAQGDRHGFATLTEAGVFAMKRVMALGLFKQIEIARWWGVSTSTVSNIATKKVWRHIP